MARTYVLLGDVVGSREIEERDRYRERLERARATVADDYDDDFVAGPSILKGLDELGGVLRSIEHVYEIAVAFGDRLHPHPVRLAVVRGAVDLGPDGDDVSRMDGPAFHGASELLESVEDAGLRFDLETGNRPLDTAVADEINLLLERRSSWTDRQREIVRLYEGTGNQYDVADELGVSQQAVSKALRAVSWPLVETIQERLRTTLEVYES